MSALVLTGACALLPGSSPVPRAGATYSGYLHMDGQDLWATVRLAESDDGVRGEVSVREGPSASGVGEVDRGRLFIGMEYEGDCPGRMVLTGEFLDDGAVIRGQVKASDCTGKMTGSFSLSSRPGLSTGT